MQAVLLPTTEPLFHEPAFFDENYSPCWSESDRTDLDELNSWVHPAIFTCHCGDSEVEVGGWCVPCGSQMLR